MVLFLSDVAQNRGWIRQRRYPNWTSSINRRYFSLAACASIFALCVLVLLVSWTNGGTQDYSAIGGLLPHSDALAYFEGAERLLQDGTLTNVSERRPLNAAFFAARLLIANENIYFAIMLQAAVVALALFLASRQMYRLQGGSAALVFLAINFAFANNCMPRTLSEALGLSLGLIAFALYCSGIARRSKVEYAIATAILTLALLARAGAMFALAASMIFALFFFARSLKERCSAVGLTLLAISLGWLVNSMLVRMYGESGLVFSNFSYVIYGLSQGGKGWQQAFKDFQPLTGSESQIAAMVYQKTLESILSNPLLMVIGLAKSLSLSLLYFPAGLLRLLGEATDGGTPRSLVPSAMVAMLLIPPLLYGAWRLLARKPFVLDSVQWFFLLHLIGFIASLPFFYLDGGIRLTAATFPFTAAAIVLILCGCKSASLPPGAVPARGNSNAFAVAIVIVAASLAAPQIGRMRNFEPGTESINCQQGDDPVGMLVGSGTAHIDIRDDDTRSVLPNIRRFDFRVSESNEIIEFWQRLNLPATILMGLDHVSHGVKIVVGHPGFADGPRRLVALCTAPLSDGILSLRARKGG